MLNAVDLEGRPFHFIGIGGIGMSAIAYILTKRHLPVSGSDVRNTHITQKLQTLGAQIFWEQNAENLDYFQRPQQVLSSTSDPEKAGATETAVLPQVICSTAIQPSNLEYQAAVRLGCPIFHRSDVLAALIGESAKSVAVAGTHGKTTTSSLIGYLLVEAGLDPTIIVGGEVAAWEGNARVGQSPYLIAEADESDGSLVKFHSHIGVITNIELDHPDHYSTLDEVVQIFQAFVDRSHHMVLCIDCETTRTRIEPNSAGGSISTYGLNRELNPDYTADSIVYGSAQTTAAIYEKGQLLGQLSFSLLGCHNLSNALAAIAVGRRLGLSFETIATALQTFEGARRRFEHRGEANGISFIDDYAHHPSEIRATLASAKLRAAARDANRRVVAVFQPHRYSRTQTFLEEFSRAFDDADCVIAMDVYSAGEAKPADMNGANVAAAIAEHHGNVSYQETLVDVAAYLKATLKPGDLVVFLGAGDLNRIIPEVLVHFQQTAADRAEVALR
ncbi:UDP-N-acetylmuramate--L-alanine ligase [Altericista sp. CCNU0014]|uniref:UDP-N-acetylmuramate--L-alanine ligase n=1 Tax=Altericista sp. CCNU0014 TaxID=3082949 RepID=UPI00384EE8F3